MTETGKNGIMDQMKDGLRSIPRILSEGVFPKIAEGAEIVVNGIDLRIMRIEKRILRKLSSFLMICLGGTFLIFALFSFLVEFLGWNNTASYFSIGIVVFIVGLLLKIGERDD